MLPATAERREAEREPGDRGSGQVSAAPEVSSGRVLGHLGGSPPASPPATPLNAVASPSRAGRRAAVRLLAPPVPRPERGVCDAGQQLVQLHQPLEPEDLLHHRAAPSPSVRAPGAPGRAGGRVPALGCGAAGRGQSGVYREEAGPPGVCSVACLTVKTTQGPSERGRVRPAVCRGAAPARGRAGAHGADPPAAAAGGHPADHSPHLAGSRSAALGPGARPPPGVTPHATPRGLFSPRGVGGWGGVCAGSGLLSLLWPSVGQPQPCSSRVSVSGPQSRGGGCCSHCSHALLPGSAPESWAQTPRETPHLWTGVTQSRMLRWHQEGFGNAYPHPWGHGAHEKLVWPQCPCGLAASSIRGGRRGETMMLQALFLKPQPEPRPAAQ